MDNPHLTDLYERLTARATDHTLTRYQLIDLATVLMLMQRDLQQGTDAGNANAINALNMQLVWIRNHAQEVSDAVLFSHIKEAVYAATQILSSDANRPQPARTPGMRGQHTHV